MPVLPWYITKRFLNSQANARLGEMHSLHKSLVYRVQCCIYLGHHLGQDRFQGQSRHELLSSGRLYA